jgi:hypothetical protein
MRLREFIGGVVLIVLTLTTAQAAMRHDPRDYVSTDALIDKSAAVTADVSVALPPVPSPLIEADKVLASAYFDMMGILSTNNECSRFFGGPAAAVDAFSKLVGRVRKDHAAPTIGMGMSGATESFLNVQTKKEYRLFEKVVLNADGPFYRGHSARSEPARRLGSFEPNTREARALIFLHELGHMVKGANGKWLLPNDGGNEGLSRRNSITIENVCADELHGLGGSQAGRDLAQRVKAEEELALPQSASAPEF